jgi:hypothetical protein
MSTIVKKLRPFYLSLQCSTIFRPFFDHFSTILRSIFSRPIIDLFRSSSNFFRHFRSFSTIFHHFSTIFSRPGMNIDMAMSNLGQRVLRPIAVAFKLQKRHKKWEIIWPQTHKLKFEPQTLFVQTFQLDFSLQIYINVQLKIRTHRQLKCLQFTHIHTPTHNHSHIHIYMCVC